jgi:hypothetical protein
MNPTTEDVKRAQSAARDLEAQGYFAKVKAGDVRAASYFARMVACRANPMGSTSDWGWLAKGGGTEVEGYADGAIVFGNDPLDLTNVLKIVTQVGSNDPSAITIGSSVQPRRQVDTWAAPIPLPSLGVYLLNGGVPHPVPPPQPFPPPFTIDRGEFIDEGFFLHGYYAAPEGLQRAEGLWKPTPKYPNGAPDFEGIGAWLFDVYLSERMKGKSRADARAAYVKQIRSSDEWRGKHPGETP